MSGYGFGRNRSSSRAALALLVLVGAAATPAAAAAQEDVKWGTDGWALQPFVGQFNDEPEFSPEQRSDQLGNDALLGGRVAFVFPSNLFVEADAAVTSPEVQPREDGPTVGSTAVLFGGSLGYNFQPMRQLQIFVSGGTEVLIWNVEGTAADGGGFDEFDPETDFALRYGTGVRLHVTRHVAIRGDVRWHQVMDALQETRSDALGVTSAADEDLWALELSGGVSFFLGGPRDPDDGGVRQAGRASGHAAGRARGPVICRR